MPLVIPPGEELCEGRELGRGSGVSSWDWEFFLLLAVLPLSIAFFISASTPCFSSVFNPQVPSCVCWGRDK